MNLLGRCYRELGMLDLAVKQLEDAARETMVMDEIKKKIVYDLGLIYEQMGDVEKYIDAMKKIYEADYGYRDVAKRVESSYRPADRRIVVCGHRLGTPLHYEIAGRDSASEKNFNSLLFVLASAMSADHLPGPVRP